MGGIEPAVDERHDCEQVFGIVFGHRPMDARLMRSGVAKHAKGAADDRASLRALTDLCRAVLNLNEFAYVD